MRRIGPGFTLIELLVVVSIMGILFSASIAYYNQFNRSQILNQAVLELKNNLRLAQSMALSGEKPASGCSSPLALEGYQATFAASLYRIQAKCSNGLLIGAERIFNLPASVVFQPVPSPIVFRVLARGIVAETTITLSAPIFGLTKSVTVTKVGEIR